MCDACHDTGFVLTVHPDGVNAAYCDCGKGQHMKEAHEVGKVGASARKPKVKKEWLPYREPGEEG